VVVTGKFGFGGSTTATFGEGEPNETTLISAQGEDVLVARYNANGTLRWAKQAAGAGPDSYGVGRDAARLPDDSVVIVGNFFGTLTFGQGEPNETSLTAPECLDVFVARYDPDGMLVWAKQAGGAAHDIGRGVAALSDGSVVVTGFFSGAAVFGAGESNETSLTSTGGSDCFIARYELDGSLTWAKQAGGAGTHGYCLTAISDDSVVVAGYFADAATFAPGEPNETSLTSVGSLDVFVARYDPDGSLAWAKRAGGFGSTEAYGVAATSDDSVVVTGRIDGAATFGAGEPNETVLTGGSISSSMMAGAVFVARYNPDGTLAWAKGTGDPWSERGLGVTVLSDDSAVVTGHAACGAVFGPGEPNEAELTSAGPFVARYRADGSFAWVKDAGGARDGWGVGVTALSDDSVVATGYFMGTATFGAGESNETTLTAPGMWDIFVARYRP
jgi:uncharacterized delta-60 repeat protein